MEEKPNILLGFHSYIPNYCLKFPNDLIDLNVEFLNSLPDIISKTKSLKLNLYLSGNVIKFLDKKILDFSSRVGNLLEENKLELLSGGIYNPIFPLISKEDRYNQIKLMNRLINHIFGYTPMGAILGENAWDSSIAYDLSKSRMLYTCLPTQHFKSILGEQGELETFYVTENEGRHVAAFPFEEQLCNMQESPSDRVNKIISEAKNRKNKTKHIVLSHPITSKDELAWIKELLEELEKRSQEVNFQLLNDSFASATTAAKRIYLPNSLDLNLETKGLNWNNSLLKYEEANLLHKKMLRVSKKINAAKEGKSRFKVIKEMINTSRELLLKAQASSVFWESDIGGITSNEERSYAYSCLIEAENLIDKASRQNSSKWIQLSEIDYNCDGKDEIIIEDDTQNIYFSPYLGGAIIEHDYRPKNLNITNAISEPGKRSLNLREYFLANSPNDNSMDLLTEKDLISYDVEKIKAKEQTCKINLLKDIVLSKHPSSPKVKIMKNISTKSGEPTLSISYSMENNSEEKIDFLFGVEFNLNLTTSSNDKVITYIDGEKAEAPFSKECLKNIALLNESNHMQCKLSFDRSLKMMAKPITVGTEQGLNLLMIFEVSLDSKATYDLNLIQELGVDSSGALLPENQLDTVNANN